MWTKRLRWNVDKVNDVANWHLHCQSSSTADRITSKRVMRRKNRTRRPRARGYNVLSSVFVTSFSSFIARSQNNTLQYHSVESSGTPIRSDQINRMTQSSLFVTLPMELVYRICDQLDPFDILMSVRDVCTRWNGIIDTYCPYQVIFISICFEGTEREREKVKWSSSVVCVECQWHLRALFSSLFSSMDEEEHKIPSRSTIISISMHRNIHRSPCMTSYELSKEIQANVFNHCQCNTIFLIKELFKHLLMRSRVIQ